MRIGGETRRDGWRRWIGPAISLAVLVASLWQLRGMPLRGVLAMVPTSPGFWLLFAATYLTLPASEWLIFRRLWTVPSSAFLTRRTCRASPREMPMFLAFFSTIDAVFMVRNEVRRVCRVGGHGCAFSSSIRPKHDLRFTCPRAYGLLTVGWPNPVVTERYRA